MSKKSLLALMAAVMSPSFSVDLGIRSAIPSQGCRTMPHRPSGVAAAKRAAKKTVKNDRLFPMAGRFSLQSRNRKNQPYQIMGKRCRRSDDL